MARGFCNDMTDDVFGEKLEGVQVPSVPIPNTENVISYTDRGSVKVGNLHYVAMELRIGNLQAGTWHVIANVPEPVSLHNNIRFNTFIFNGTILIPTAGNINTLGQIEVYIPPATQLGSNNGLNLNFWYNNIN